MTSRDKRASGGPHQAYPVRTAARLTGLTPDLIRAWERRYAVVHPVRGPRGARLYDNDDIAHLRLLAQLVARGRAIGDIARLDRATLTSLVGEPAEPGGAPELSGEDGHVLEEVLAAAADFDAERARALLGKALLAMGSGDFVRRVGAPLLLEVGNRWHSGQLSVAEEHLISALLRDLLLGLGQVRAARRAPAALLATPSGERHDLGLALVALLFLEAGLSVTHLGADLPAAEIVRAAAHSPVSVVGLSLVNHDNLRQAIGDVREIEARLSRDVEIWLGGAQAPQVAHALPGTRALVLQDLADVEAHVRRVAGTSPT